MKLWLISQNENNTYDTYDAVVVAAENEDAARFTHPYGLDRDWSEYSCWVRSPDKVTAKFIGEAAPDIKAGVILASFNAG